MKYSRLFLGLLIIAISIWVIFGEQIAGASSDAVVNAPVVTLRSHVAGELTLSPRVLGARVSENEMLGSVSDPLVDSLRLDDLTVEASVAEAEVARIGAEVDANRTMKADLTERADAFRERRIEELELQLAHANARLAIIEGAMPGAGAQALADAVSRQVVRGEAEPLLPELALDRARELILMLGIELRAARSGVYIEDGNSDAPYAEQQITGLSGAIAAGEAALLAARTRATALQNRLSREKVRVNRLAGGEFHSPVDGLYWEVLQASGVTVQRGDPILRIVDCGSTVVTLSVSENVYNTLRLGQAAAFRLSGDRRVFEGSISRLAGSGAATIYENLAVAPSGRHLERYDVTLIVPDLTEDTNLSCAIGRTGRVFFDRRPLDWFRGFFK